MDSYLKLKMPDIPYFLIYKTLNKGLIELKKITNELTILKIYLQNFKIINEPQENEEVWFEDSIDIMISNYYVKYNNIDELNGVTICIERGWEPEFLLAMLSIYDGEEINNIKVKFTKVSEECFEIVWTGYYGEGEKNVDDIEIKTLVYKDNEIVTPICMYDSELIEYYNRNNDDMKIE